jgi:hypothetical protein
VVQGLHEHGGEGIRDKEFDSIQSCVVRVNGCKGLPIKKMLGGGN